MARGSSDITLDVEIAYERTRANLARPPDRAMKEAAGRPEDLLVASEYRVLSDELRRPNHDAER